MDFKIINRTILIVGLLLIIIGTGVLLDRSNTGRDYFSWIKSVLSDLNPLKAGIIRDFPASEDLELDYSDIDFESLMSEGKSSSVPLGSISEDKEEGFSEESQEQEEEIALESKPVTLTEIEEKINKIAEKSKKISQEIETLSVLNEIKKEIDIIAERAKKIGQEVNKLVILAELQEKVDKLAEKTEEISESV